MLLDAVERDTLRSIRGPTPLKDGLVCVITLKPTELAHLTGLVIIIDKVFRRYR